MKKISESLLAELSSDTRWSLALSKRLDTLKKHMEHPSCAASALELARAFEHCARDRTGAIASYVLCFRSDNAQVEALARARALSVEMGDFATTAKLARLQYKQDGDPWHLADSGVAWIDAGQPDRAIKPLMAAARAIPDSDYIASALRTARREWPSVRHEVARLMQKADEEDTYEAASDAVLQAARMLCMLQTNQISLEKLLLVSLQHDPENASALGLLERRLSHVDDREALLEVYERRLANRETVYERVDELRRAGMCLHQVPAFSALGVRLAHRALQVAYKEKLSYIPGHLAIVELLREHYEDGGHLRRFMELIETALALPLPELDTLYLALQGLDVALHHVGDNESAGAYADIVCRLGPNHGPLVAEARARGLVGSATSSSSAAAVQEERRGDGIYLDSVLLDQVPHEAPKPSVGQGPTLREQLATASSAAAHQNPSYEEDAPLELAETSFTASLETAGGSVGMGVEPLELDDAPLEMVELDEAPLEMVELDDAPLEMVELDEAPLEMVELDDAPLEMVELDEAPVEMVELDEAPLEMVELDEAPQGNAQRPEAEPRAADAPTHSADFATSDTPFDDAEVEAALDFDFAAPSTPPSKPLPSIAAPKAKPVPAPAKPLPPIKAPTEAPKPAPTSTQPKKPAPVDPLDDGWDVPVVAAPKPPKKSSRRSPSTNRLSAAPNVAKAPPAPRASSPATLGKISLIPSSAMSALKKASDRREALPANAKDRAPRLPMPVRVEFRVGDELRSCLTRDVSATGAFLITKDAPQVGAILALTAKMPLSRDSMRTEPMCVRARVVRTTDVGVGVAFENPSNTFQTRLDELLAQS